MEYVSDIFPETLGSYWYHYGTVCGQPCVDKPIASSTWTSKWRRLQSRESHADCCRCILPDRYQIFPPFIIRQMFWYDLQIETANPRRSWNLCFIREFRYRTNIICITIGIFLEGNLNRKGNWWTPFKISQNYWASGLDQWVRLSLSNGPNSVDISLPSHEDGNRSRFRNVVLSTHFESRKANKTCKPSNSELSEPIRI
jgi:hypothetical protein